MFNGKLLKFSGTVAVFLFVLFAFSTTIGLAKKYDNILIKARKLYQDGDYEGSIHLLNKYVNKLKKKVERKQDVVEGFYLLAKIYFEVGDDARAGENLMKVYNACPEFEKEEPHAIFKKKVEEIKQKVEAEKKLASEKTKKNEIKAESEQFEPEGKESKLDQTKPKSKKKNPCCDSGR